MSDLKKEYEVVRNHTLDFKVGSIVELTDKQAKKLVNKVKQRMLDTEHKRCIPPTFRP